MTRVYVAIILIAFTGGCADFRTYMKDRGNDLADCFKGDVGYGFGLGAHVRATDLLSLGAGGGYMWKHGFKGRRSGEWNDILLGWPASNVVFAFDVMPDMFGGGTTIGNNGSDLVFALIMCIPMNYASVGRLPRQTGCEAPNQNEEFFKNSFTTHSIFGLNILALERRTPENPQGRPGTYSCPPMEMLDIEFGVMAGFVGLHFGFSPIQFVDFLCGWFGLDFPRDDIRSRPAAPPYPVPEPGR